MTELEKKIKKASDAYYNSNPIISDEEFDALFDRLKKEHPSSVLLKKVGEDESEDFEKAKHILFMNSQEKVNNEKDFFHWWGKRKINKALVQHKLDGISIELQYVSGFLFQAVSRGNGEVGDLLTENVRKMEGVPSKIRVGTDSTVAIRGEIILKKSKFEKYKKQGFANPRNMASGIAKNKHGENCEDLSIIVYDVYSPDFTFDDELQKQNFLFSQGFEVVDSFLATSKEEVIAYRENVINDIREELEYDIDGLVVKSNDIIESDFSRVRPQYQIAFKFDSIYVSTRIKDIEWSVSGKIVTPIAILEPVLLQGATISKASLANPDRVKELDLNEGDLVIISRRGEIIPYVEKIAEKNEDGEKFLHCIEEIEYNDKKYSVRNEGVKAVIEDEQFPLIAYHRIRKWLDKLNVKGFGEALLTDLFNKEFVKDIDDLYTIDLNKYLETTNLKKATEKAFANLNNKRKIKLEIFFGGLDIENAGEKVFKMLVSAGYDTIEKIRNISYEELSAIDGISDFRARAILQGLQELNDLIDSLLNFVEVEEVKILSENNENVKGKSFCFTGFLETMKRQEAKEKIENAGGFFTTSVSKKTDYLVTNTPESGSGKNKKANDLNVKIITEKQLLEML